MIAAHGGGFLPSYADRSDHACLVNPGGCNPEIKLKKKPTEYLKQIYFDSLVFTPEAMRHLAAQVGASQIVLGSDYPFPGSCSRSTTSSRRPRSATTRRRTCWGARRRSCLGSGREGRSVGWVELSANPRSALDQSVFRPPSCGSSVNTTGVPFFTFLPSQATSQLVNRTHPCDLRFAQPAWIGRAMNAIAFRRQTNPI